MMGDPKSTLSLVNGRQRPLKGADGGGKGGAMRLPPYSLMRLVRRFSLDFTSSLASVMELVS
jgi:hypothetical protein